MSTDLVEVLRQRVFSILDSVRPHGNYKTLILDEYVKTQFARIIDQREFLNRQVVSIHTLDHRRPTESTFEAIYIVKPTVYNIECIGADYTRQPPRYKCAHIFFLPGLTADLERKLSNSQAARFVRKMDIAYIDFRPIESQVFSFDDPYAMDIFYNDACTNLIMDYCRKTAQQIVSVCSILGEYPIIRFYKQEKETYRANSLSYLLAEEVQNQIDAYARRDASFAGASEARSRAVLLILDRSLDPFAPFLHEFTFQALAHDLLNIQDGRKYSYETDINGTMSKVDGIINEKDAEWAGLRHSHMQEVIETLVDKMARLKKENPHYAGAQAPGMEAPKTNVSDLQNMVAFLPQFMQTREKFALYLQMATECMTIIQEKGLTDLAEIEQTTALGVEADGRKPKFLSDNVIEMLADPRFGKMERVRLLAIYALHRDPGLIASDFKKLKQHCQLDDSDLQALYNLSILGNPVVKESLQAKATRPGSKTGPPVRPKYYSHATEDVYSVSRYVPAVKNLVEQLIHGQLPASPFPYTRDPGPEEGEVDGHTSLRRQRAVWAKTGANQTAKQRIFVFVAGGATYSEMRAVYELNQKYPKEIIIGSNDIITPSSFIRSLWHMTADRRSLDLPIDRQPKRAPQFLFESDRDNRKVQAEEEQRRAAQQQQQQAAATTGGGLLGSKSKKAAPEVPQLKKVGKTSRLQKMFSRS